MDFDSLKEFFLNKLQMHDYSDFNGAKLSLYLPIHKDLLNLVVENIISTSTQMHDLDYLVLDELENNRLLIDIKHKKIDKTIRAEIHEIEYNSKSEPILSIEFLEGLQFYEKLALDSAITLRKGWQKVKTWFNGEPGADEKSNLPIKISSSGLILNLAKAFSYLELDYLNRLIVWKQISTSENKLIIGLNITLEV